MRGLFDTTRSEDSNRIGDYIVRGSPNLRGPGFGITRSLPTVLVGEPIYRFRF